VNYGVPQGSILGPLLYIIYINDLELYKINGKKIMYADDLGIFYENSDDKQTQEKINEDVKTLMDWTTTNYLTLNVKKCNIIHFETTIKDHKLDVTIQNEKLTEIDHVTYLGLTMDRQLKWTKHIQNLITELSSQTALFNKIHK
jgi:hypothetical protein